MALGTDALTLRLLGEDSATSNDPEAGGPSAREQVSPLTIASSLVPALGGASQPAVTTSSTGGEDAKTTPGVDLGGILGGLPVPGLLSGTIDPVSLRSLVDANGAVSGATGAVRDLSVLGGLLSTGTGPSFLGSSALTTDAGAARGLELDRLEVLDLSALLDALGISLADLPLDAAVGLLDGLGLPLPGGFTDPAALLTEIDGLLADSGPVRSQVTTLQGQVDSLQAQLTTASGQVTSLTSQLSAQQALLAACVVPALCAPIQAQITNLATQLASAQALVATLNTQIDSLQAQIEDLLDTIDALLDELLGLLDGLLAGLDAAAALSQVTALTDQITGTLGDLLGGIDPSLAGLVDVDLLDQATSVTEADGVTTAIAGITALRATITSPGVCALLGRLGAQETLGSVLGSLGEALPSLPGPVGDVLGDLGSTVTCGAGAAAAGQVGAAALVDGVASALTQPLTIEALTMTGTGSYAVPMTPGSPGTPAGPGAPTPGSLPRTGGDAGMALLALGLGVAGFGVRRLLARSAI